MLQRLFTKYWLAFNIGFTVVLTWLILPQSIRSSSFSFLLLMSFLIVEMTLLLPSVYRGETLQTARVRALSNLTHDGFAYTALFVLLYLGVQWLNGGLESVYDIRAGVWGYQAPDAGWLPGSVKSGDAFRAFNVAAALLIIGCALRNAVGKRAKRALLQWLSVCSGVFALFAVAKGLLGGEPYSAYMHTPLTCGWGTFFGFWMIVAIGAFAESLSAQSGRPYLVYVFGIAFNLIGVLFYASLPAMLFYSALSIILMVYAGISIAFHAPKHFNVKMFFLTVLVYLSILGGGYFALPEGAVASKINNVSEITEHFEQIAATRSVRMDAAMQIWQDHIWYGSGVNGFEHYLGSVLDDQAWSKVRADKGFVYNDMVQILCEFGILGSAALAAVIVTLLVPLFYRAHIAWVKDTRDANAGRKYILRISPFVVTGVIATLVCLAESLAASPFRMPAMVFSFFVVLLTMPAFLPAR